MQIFINSGLVLMSHKPTCLSGNFFNIVYIEVYFVLVFGGCGNVVSSFFDFIIHCLIMKVISAPLCFYSWTSFLHICSFTLRISRLIDCHNFHALCSWAFLDVSSGTRSYSAPWWQHENNRILRYLFDVVGLCNCVFFRTLYKNRAYTHTYIHTYVFIY